jgi:hypothetical protein
MKDGLTALLRYVIRSFLSFSFFKPAKAIFVPGMYWLKEALSESIHKTRSKPCTFLGFSRYSKSVSPDHTTPLLTLAAV